jgi:hypothetical protein
MFSRVAQLTKSFYKLLFQEDDPHEAQYPAAFNGFGGSGPDRPCFQ